VEERTDAQVQLAPMTWVKGQKTNLNP
jgi:hypothetical protein